MFNYMLLFYLVIVRVDSHYQYCLFPLNSLDLNLLFKISELIFVIEPLILITLELNYFLLLLMKVNIIPLNFLVNIVILNFILHIQAFQPQQTTILTLVVLLTYPLPKFPLKLICDLSQNDPQELKHCRTSNWLCF